MGGGGMAKIDFYDLTLNSKFITCTKTMFLDTTALLAYKVITNRHLQLKILLKLVEVSVPKA